MYKSANGPMILLLSFGAMRQIWSKKQFLTNIQGDFEGQDDFEAHILQTKLIIKYKQISW